MQRTEQDPEYGPSASSQEAQRPTDVWRYLKADCDAHERRINFFLVAESMLVVSFAQRVSSGPRWFLNSIVALGLVYTLSRFYVNRRLGQRLQSLYEKQKKFDRIYREYLAGVRGVTSMQVENYILPLATAVFWVFLLVWLNWIIPW